MRMILIIFVIHSDFIFLSDLLSFRWLIWMVIFGFFINNLIWVIILSENIGPLIPATWLTDDIVFVNFLIGRLVSLISHAAVLFSFFILFMICITLFAVFVDLLKQSWRLDHDSIISVILSIVISSFSNSFVWDKRSLNLIKVGVFFHV